MAVRERNGSNTKTIVRRRAVLSLGSQGDVRVDIGVYAQDRADALGGVIKLGDENGVVAVVAQTLNLFRHSALTRASDKVNRVMAHDEAVATGVAKSKAARRAGVAPHVLEKLMRDGVCPNGQPPLGDGVVVDMATKVVTTSSAVPMVHSTKEHVHMLPTSNYFISSTVAETTVKVEVSFKSVKVSPHAESRGMTEADVPGDNTKLTVDLVGSSGVNSVRDTRTGLTQEMRVSYDAIHLGGRTTARVKLEGDRDRVVYGGNLERVDYDADGLMGLKLSMNVAVTKLGKGMRAVSHQSTQDRAEGAPHFLMSRDGVIIDGGPKMGKLVNSTSLWTAEPTAVYGGVMTIRGGRVHSVDRTDRVVVLPFDVQSVSALLGLRMEILCVDGDMRRPSQEASNLARAYYDAMAKVTGLDPAVVKIVEGWRRAGRPTTSSTDVMRFVCLEEDEEDENCIHINIVLAREMLVSNGYGKAPDEVRVAGGTITMTHTTIARAAVRHMSLMPCIGIMRNGRLATPVFSAHISSAPFFTPMITRVGTGAPKSLITFIKPELRLRVRKSTSGNLLGWIRPAFKPRSKLEDASVPVLVGGQIFDAMDVAHELGAFLRKRGPRVALMCRTALGTFYARFDGDHPIVIISPSKRASTITGTGRVVKVFDSEGIERGIEGMFHRAEAVYYGHSMWGQVV
jgi:hypothetical protein